MARQPARGGRSRGSQGRSRAKGKPSRPPQSQPQSQRRAPGSPPPAARRRGPKGLGGTQVEGRQAVRELLLAGTRRVKEVLIASDMHGGDIIDDIVSLSNELRVPVTEISRSKLDAKSFTDAAQGVIAFAQPVPEVALDDLIQPMPGQPPFLLALDGVTDPGNLGAILRIGECAGVTGVILPKHRSVHISPTVTKTAVGAVEHLPMTLVGGIPATIAQLKQANIMVIGLDMGGDTVIHDLPDISEGVCLILGAEGKGLSRLVAERSDIVASIPQYGRLDSLNVAAAAAIASFEVARRLHH